MIKVLGRYVDNFFPDCSGWGWLICKFNFNFIFWNTGVKYNINKTKNYYICG